METREDIVREMREGAALFADKGDRLFANVLAGFAKRVEALGGADGAAPAKLGCGGNVAKIREALESIYIDAQFICDNREEAMLVEHRANRIERTVNAALAEPPRNCDVPYPDTVAMYDAFKKWCNNKGHTMEPKLATDAFDWMLVTATPERGGK